MNGYEIVDFEEYCQYCKYFLEGDLCEKCLSVKKRERTDIPINFVANIYATGWVPFLN